LKRPFEGLLKAFKKPFKRPLQGLQSQGLSSTLWSLLAPHGSPPSQKKKKKEEEEEEEEEEDLLPHDPL
jgi:hypothetical protein